MMNRCPPQYTRSWSRSPFERSSEYLRQTSCRSAGKTGLRKRQAKRQSYHNPANGSAPPAAHGARSQRISEGNPSRDYQTSRAYGRRIQHAAHVNDGYRRSGKHPRPPHLNNAVQKAGAGLLRFTARAPGPPHARIALP